MLQREKWFPRKFDPVVIRFEATEQRLHIEGRLNQFANESHALDCYLIAAGATAIALFILRTLGWIEGRFETQKSK